MQNQAEVGLMNIDSLMIVIIMALILGVYIPVVLKSHREEQEKITRQVLANFGDYLLAHLMTPEEVTTIPSDHPKAGTDEYKDYVLISLETARISARQNLTHQDLADVIKSGWEQAEKLKQKLGLFAM